jgi:hypothetical protein
MDVYRMHRRARDRTRIKVREPLEVRNWATTLGCTEGELRDAVEKVGVGTDDVRKHLGK